MRQITGPLAADTITFLSTCLTAALNYAPDALEVDDALFRTLATALVEGWEDGLSEPADLTALAVRALPLTRH